MLTEICAELKNWFIKDEQDIHEGTFTVDGADIAPLDFLQDGQYFRIVGSVFNDGVHKKDSSLNLVSETFDGAIWAMRLPKAVIDLDGKIKDWIDKYGEAADSPYNSESFGGYSYTKGGSSGASGASGNGWKHSFAGELNKWRKI